MGQQTHRQEDERKIEMLRLYNQADACFLPENWKVIRHLRSVLCAFSFPDNEPQLRHPVDGHASTNDR